MDKKVLSLIIFSSTLTVMAGAVLGPVVNTMKEVLDVTPSQAGYIITVHGILIALTSPLAGYLIDSYGFKRSLCLGLILYGISGGSGLIINSYTLLIVSRVFFGIAVAFVYSSVTVAILALYREDRRNRVMGWRNSANSLGAIIWPLIGGALGAVSWHLPFGVYLVALPLALFCIFLLPDENVNNKLSDKDSVFAIFRRKPVVYVIYGLMFLANVFLYVIVVFIPQLLELYGIKNPFYVSLFLAAMGTTAALAAFFYGELKEIFRFRELITIVPALWTAGFFFIPVFHLKIFTAAAVSLVGMGLGIMFPTLMLWIDLEVPEEFRGRFASYLGTFGFTGQFCAPLLFAPVVTYLGLKKVFTVASILSLTLLISAIIKLLRGGKDIAQTR